MAKKFFNLRPAVFVAVGICFGIATAYFFFFGNIVLGLLFCLLFVSLCTVVFLPCYKEFSVRGKIALTLLMSALFVFSGAVFGETVNDFDNANLNNHYFLVRAKVVETQDTSIGKRLLIDDLNVKGIIDGELKYKAYLYVTGSCYADIGDKVEFSAYLCDKFSVYENEFAAYDVLRGIKYTAQIPTNELKITRSSPSVFERVNLFMRDTLKSGLEGDGFSVAYALLTGNGEYMDYDTVTSYRMAGVAHIFAVSGLHIGFLATALGFLFDKLKVKSLFKAILITVVLIFYSGVCGFSASSIRAVVMSTVALFASVKGRRYDGLTSISVAAAIILCISPTQFFSVGFALSFTVVLGMLLLSKPMGRLLKFLPQKLSSSLGTVISAQLASVPICLSAFGYFSPIAVIVNLIFLPAVSVIFIGLLIATLIGGILKIPVIMLFVPKYVLMFVNMCISAFDFEKLIIGGFSMGAFSVLYYLAMIIPSDFLNLKKLTKIIATSICVIVCIVGSVFVTFSDNHKSKIYVIGSENLCVTLIETPKDNMLLVSDAARVFSSSRLKRIADKYGVKNIDAVVFFGGSSVDEQEFLTKLRTVFNLSRICYYGAKDALKETVIKKSFSLNIENFLDGQDFGIHGINCEYALDGQAVDLTVAGKKVSVFSASSDMTEYAGLSGRYDVMICGNQPSLAFAYYNPKTAVCYRRNATFTDGESRGTAILEII